MDFDVIKGNGKESNLYGIAEEKQQESIRFLTVADLASLPPTKWLVQETLPQGGLACLFGPSGLGKSFLALDWALCVATGKGSWMGKTVQAGPVVYIAAEGISDFYSRIEAWQKAYRIDKVDNLFLYGDAVNLMSASKVESFLKAVSHQVGKPALIVVDTLARCFIGGEENSASDMGVFVHGADKLRKETGSTVLIIHHSGKEQDKGARGSSALHAAADTMLHMKGADDVITVSCAKQKDAAAFNPWSLVPILVNTSTKASRVLKPAAGRELSRDITPNQRILLEVLASPLYRAGGALNGELLTATELNEKNLYRAQDILSKRMHIRIDGPPKTRNRRYFITAEGLRALDGLTALDDNSGSEMDSDSFAT